MRFFPVAYLLVLALGACKKDQYLPDSILNSSVIAPQPSLNLSFLSSGPVQFVGNIASRLCNDTLHIEAINGHNFMEIWLLTVSLKDSTYLLNGKNGGVKLYDSRGNLLGISAYNFSVIVHAEGHLIDGFLLGPMSSQGSTQPANGQFSKVAVWSTQG